MAKVNPLQARRFDYKFMRHRSAGRPARDEAAPALSLSKTAESGATIQHTGISRLA